MLKAIIPQEIHASGTSKEKHTSYKHDPRSAGFRIGRYLIYDFKIKYDYLALISYYIGDLRYSFNIYFLFPLPSLINYFLRYQRKSRH